MDVPTLTDDNTDELGGLNDILGLRIRLAHGAVYRHFTDTFIDLGLTQKQVSALWLVGDHPGISQIELGRRLRMSRTTRSWSSSGPTSADRRATAARTSRLTTGIVGKMR